MRGGVAAQVLVQHVVPRPEEREQHRPRVAVDLPQLVPALVRVALRHGAHGRQGRQPPEAADAREVPRQVGVQLLVYWSTRICCREK